MNHRQLPAARLLVLAAMALVALTGRGQEDAGNYSYLLGAKDLLDVRVLEVPELNVERRVSEGGLIDLPLIGQLPVAGLTAEEAGQRLQTLLQSKYVNSATVSIAVKEFVHRAVSVVGAVQRPGPLSVSGQWDLVQVISAAGGLSSSAGRRIYVTRRAQNGLADTLEIQADELFRGGSTRWNITIFPSDIINVPLRSTVKLFCLGEVMHPGSIEFDSDDRITLLSVIAKAGGLTDRASSRIRVKRKSEDGTADEEILLNYRGVVSGKDKDPILRPDDIIIVASALF
jgi:polysaccharide export outer membrane protein